MVGQCLPPFLSSLNLLCLGQLLLQGTNGCLQLVEFINETILGLEAKGQDGIRSSATLRFSWPQSCPGPERLLPQEPGQG